MADDDRSYDVGYKKPPKKHRFKKGKSGNRKGRQKKSRNLVTIAQQILDEKVAVREGGKLREISKLEGLCRSAINFGLQGDPRAFMTAMTFLQKLGFLEPPAPPDVIKGGVIVVPADVTPEEWERRERERMEKERARREGRLDPDSDNN